MNTNIILDGFAAIINQLIATAVAEAVKPLQARILALEDGYVDWKAMEHLTAKAVQPMLNRLTSLEINQTLVSSAKGDFNEAVRNVLDDGEYVKREDIYDAVTTAIDNYDFSDIIEENMPDPVSEDTVQGMIDDALSSLVVVRT